MEQTEVWTSKAEPAPKRLVQAFAASLIIHLLTFGVLEVGREQGWWEENLLTVLAHELGLDEWVERKPEPEPESPREVPMVFVDVDPSQATETPPEDTPYYSPFNSIAGNPDTSQDTETPEIEGDQDKVMKTMDTERADAVVQPLQPDPVEPDPGSDLAEEAELVESAKPQPEVAEAEKESTDPAAPAPLAAPEREKDPGDLAMVEQKAQPKFSATVTGSRQARERPRTRPRTVAAAKAMKQENPNSALLGEKIQQEGGVKRHSIVSSLDVKSSLFGSYDARFIAAVQACWFELLRQRRYTMDRMGLVKLKFRLTKDGAITNMETLDESVGDFYTSLCQLAVQKPAPYDKWPVDMRRILREDYREVVFTFYY